VELGGGLQKRSFSQIDLSDPFFDSLKDDYKEFADWFGRKRDNEAYVAMTETGALDGFLYLKQENGAVDDIDPPLPAANRVKIGTFKINPHGTRLGERFLKKAFDYALHIGAAELYVTVFERHKVLCQLFARYGFCNAATKKSSNGEEVVLHRVLRQFTGDVVADYPAIPVQRDRHFLLAIKPEWHSRLLPDSLLATEHTSIIEDVSHSNSIHKLYLTAMREVADFKRGDTVVVYRTTDFKGPAYRRSVVTSICVVEEIKNIGEFSHADDFLKYAEPYSVFTRDELMNFFRTRKWPLLLRFTYNLALKRRVNRAQLIEDVGIDSNVRWGCLSLSSKQFARILKLSGDYESALINKTAFR